MTPQGHKNWVLCVAWSPDAKFLISGSMDGQVLVWQADTGKLKGVCRVSIVDACKNPCKAGSCEKRDRLGRHIAASSRACAG